MKKLLGKSIISLCGIFFIILLTSRFVLLSQNTKINRINNQRSIELEAVQTPAKTFITAIMATDQTTPMDAAVKIYRSSNNGISLDSVFCIGPEGDFVRNPDPVLTVDSAGNVYVITMRIGTNNMIGQLWIYKSTDDGLTWQFSGIPYKENYLADYPQITSHGNGSIFLSYTDYRVGEAFINFNSSHDGGKTWTGPKQIIPSVSSEMFVGSDINWAKDNRLWITFGDYNSSSIYVTSSIDNGKTWSAIKQLGNITSYTVNKIVSNKNFDHLGVISHNPHTTKSNIYFSYTTDAGKSWKLNVLDNNSAYSEGVIDNDGNIHVIFNQVLNNTFNLIYVFSKDKGQTFSYPLKLFSAPRSGTSAYGEYQSLILAADGMLHLTFVDLSDTLKTKQIIFSPLLTNVEESNLTSDIPSVYPNPVKDYINIKLNSKINSGIYELFGLNGELVRSGNLTENSESVNIAGLNSGTYILRITCENRIFINKVVKTP